MPTLIPNASSFRPFYGVDNLFLLDTYGLYLLWFVVFVLCSPGIRIAWVFVTYQTAGISIHLFVYVNCEHFAFMRMRVRALSAGSMDEQLSFAGVCLGRFMLWELPSL